MPSHDTWTNPVLHWQLLVKLVDLVLAYYMPTALSRVKLGCMCACVCSSPRLWEACCNITDKTWPHGPTALSVPLYMHHAFLRVRSMVRHTC